MFTFQNFLLLPFSGEKNDFGKTFCHFFFSQKGNDETFSAIITKKQGLWDIL